MKEFEHILQNKLGFQAKAAGEFVQMVKSLDSAVTVSKDDKVVSADKLLSLVSLDGHKGDAITFTFEDDVREEDVEKIREFIGKYL